MLILPADKTTIMKNYFAEYSKPERQYSNFPFDPVLREYLQGLYRDCFYVDPTGGSGEEEEKLVRVKRLLAFEKKGIESIELYMVGVYFQGDLSVPALTAIPGEVFTRLKFMSGRPADFFTQTAKYILSLTTWCHLIIENCPVNLGFIKSTDFCSKMVSSLKSELAFAGKKQTSRKCSLRGCITIKNNYSFGEHEYGIMAGRSVFVEIPKAQFLSDAGIKEWMVNLVHAKEEEDIIAAAAAAAATVVIGTSSTGPLADTVVTAAITSSVAPTDKSSLAPVVTSDDAAIVDASSAITTGAKTDLSVGATDEVSPVTTVTTVSAIGPVEEVPMTKVVAAIPTAPVVSSVPITAASASSVITTEASTMAAVVTTGTSLLLAPDESSVTAAAAAAAEASTIAAAVTTVTIVSARGPVEEVLITKVVAAIPTAPVVSSVPITTASASSVITTEASTMAAVVTTGTSLLLAPDESSVTAAAALQKNYDENESFKNSVKRNRGNYLKECESSPKVLGLGSLLLKNNVKLRATINMIDIMKEFLKKNMFHKDSQSHKDFKQGRKSLNTLIAEIEADNISILKEKSDLLDNTFNANDLVPAIVYTSTTKTCDIKKLKLYREKKSANHEIGDLQGNESMVFNGLNALVYNMQDSFILCLRSAYSGGKIEYDKITETYGNLSTFINQWFFLLKPPQQKKILNLFIEQDAKNNIIDDCNEILLVLTTKALLDMNEYVGTLSNNQCNFKLVLIWEANNHAFSITKKGETGTTTTKVTKAST